MIPFVKKIPAVEHFKALVLMFKTVKTPPNRQKPISFVSFLDLLAKAYFAKPLAAFGKTFVRRSSTRFGFLLVPYRVFGPIYTYFKLNCLNFYSSLSYS